MRLAVRWFTRTAEIAVDQLTRQISHHLRQIIHVGGTSSRFGHCTVELPHSPHLIGAAPFEHFHDR